MKRGIVFVLGLAISVLCLYLIFKDLDLEAFADAFRSFNLLWLIPSLFFFYWSMYLRAVRWGLLFRPRYQIPGRRLFGPLMICFAFNSILPGRLGEIVRAYLVGKTEKTGMPSALATVVSERIFDSVTLLTALGIALALLSPLNLDESVKVWNVEIDGSMLGPLIFTIVAVCVIAVVGALCFMVPAGPPFMVRMARRVPGIPGRSARLAKMSVAVERLRTMVIQLIEGLARGFESVRDPRTLLGIVAYSIVLWGMIALSNLMLAYGFDLTMSYVEAVAIMALIAVFIVIPAAPGYWGLYEAGALFSLVVLGIEEDQSIGLAYAIVMHLVQFVPIVLIGLVFAARAHVSLRDVRESSETK